MEKRNNKTNKLLGNMGVMGMGSSRRLISLTLALSSMVFGIWIDFALTYRSVWSYISAAFWLAIVLLSYKALQVEGGDDK